MDASMNHESSFRIARRGATLAAVLVLGLAASGCNKLKARDLLNKGVTAFKAGQSDAAIEDFKRARDLDPSLMNARLYLATAYAASYIPGAPSPENKARGEQAIQEFQDVLQLDPKNLTAIDGIGSLLFQMAGTPPVSPQGFLDSKQYHQKHIDLKPDDPEPYYWIGVIDWTLAFHDNGEMRLDYNKSNIKKQIKQDDPLPPAVRSQFAGKDGQVIDEGIGDLQKAISLRPDYDDAMAYLNLLYRQKADTAESQAERDTLRKQADDLVEKVKEIKQKRLEQPQTSS
jgi:tetratricopeptide (TPR) repeat protein